MARMQRNNVVLHVSEDDVQRYIQLGYNLTDEKGNVIKGAIPNDFATLQRAYVDHQAKIENLENMVATLTQELTALKQIKTRKKSE